MVKTSKIGKSAAKLPNMEEGSTTKWLWALKSLRYSLVPLKYLEREGIIGTNVPRNGGLWKESYVHNFT